MKEYLKQLIRSSSSPVEAPNQAREDFNPIVQKKVLWQEVNKIVNIARRHAAISYLSGSYRICSKIVGSLI